MQEMVKNDIKAMYVLFLALDELFQCVCHAIIDGK